MKKLLFILFFISFPLLCMEEGIVKQEGPAQKKQRRRYKQSIFNISPKVPVQPVQDISDFIELIDPVRQPQSFDEKKYYVVGKFDINTPEKISGKPFKEIIEMRDKKHLPFVVASMPEGAAGFVKQYYYDAYALIARIKLEEDLQNPPHVNFYLMATPKDRSLKYFGSYNDIKNSDAQGIEKELRDRFINVLYAFMPDEIIGDNHDLIDNHLKALWELYYQFAAEKNRRETYRVLELLANNRYNLIDQIGGITKLAATHLAVLEKEPAQKTKVVWLIQNLLERLKQPMLSKKKLEEIEVDIKIRLAPYKKIDSVENFLHEFEQIKTSKEPQTTAAETQTEG